MRKPNRKARRTMICENIFAHCDQLMVELLLALSAIQNPQGYGHVRLKTIEKHIGLHLGVFWTIPRNASSAPVITIAAILLISDSVRNTTMPRSREQESWETTEREKQRSFQISTRDVIFIRRCRDIYNSAEMAAMLNTLNVALLLKFLTAQFGSM
jgi:hypothetical protein